MKVDDGNTQEGKPTTTTTTTTTTVNQKNLKLMVYKKKVVSLTFENLQLYQIKCHDYH